ncbi:hypothetical protein OsI_07039 [Oryza sativa Indica Group]|uniref:Uncharacterized protein n=1 Tax=Oryza sativa subsp. indica TaxID=39946 RepID=B8AH31_ORYSI|nr:hypothetical protein OsI_07039 [Oryza sativa Indica Group]
MCATQSSVRPAPPSSVRHRLYPRQPRRCPFAAAIVVVLRSFRASKRGHRACLGRSSACGARRCSRAEPGAASRWRRYDAGSSLPGLVSSMPGRRHDDATTKAVEAIAVEASCRDRENTSVLITGEKKEWLCGEQVEEKEAEKTKQASNKESPLAYA